MEPPEMKDLVSDVTIAYQSLGNVFYGSTDAEIPSLKFKRSLYVVKDIKKGEQFTIENVRSIRPANGLSTKFYEEIINRKARIDIFAGTPLSESLIK